MRPGIAYSRSIPPMEKQPDAWRWYKGRRLDVLQTSTCFATRDPIFDDPRNLYVTSCVLKHLLLSQLTLLSNRSRDADKVTHVSPRVETALVWPGTRT